MRFRKSDLAIVASALALLALGIAALIGWILNIVTLVGMEAMNGEFVVRIIGIFIAPVGAVAGWF